MSLDVHVHVGGLPPAKKPIVVSSVFDASANRMVVTAVFPMRDGKVYVNDERESVQRIVTKAIRSEYHNGNSGEAEIANLKSEGERMKAEIARLQGVIVKLEDPVPMLTLNVAELSAIDVYCQKFGHNVLLQRRNGNLVISSPTGRNPLEVEMYHG